MNNRSLGVKRVDILPKYHGFPPYSQSFNALRTSVPTRNGCDQGEEIQGAGDGERYREHQCGSEFHFVYVIRQIFSPEAEVGRD